MQEANNDEILIKKYDDLLKKVHKHLEREVEEGAKCKKAKEDQRGC